MISKIFNYFLPEVYNTPSASTRSPTDSPEYIIKAPKIILQSTLNITDKYYYFKKILKHGKDLDINAEKKRIFKFLFRYELKHATPKKQLEIQKCLSIYEAHATLLLKRCIQQHPEFETKKTLPALELIAFVVALKYDSDDSIWNKRIKPKSINQIYFNEMERVFLNLIDWKVHIENIQSLKAELGIQKIKLSTIKKE